MLHPAGKIFGPRTRYKRSPDRLPSYIAPAGKIKIARQTIFHTSKPRLIRTSSPRFLLSWPAPLDSLEC